MKFNKLFALFLALALCLTPLLLAAPSASAVETWYTNLADPSDPEWLWGYRISASSGGIVDSTENFVTNYIPCQYGDVLRFYNGEQIPGALSSAFYDSDLNVIAYFSNSKFSYSADTGVATLTVGIDGTANYPNVAYVRITGKTSSLSYADYIITVNQDFLGDPPAVDPENPDEPAYTPTGLYYSAFRILADNIYGYGAVLNTDQNFTLTILATLAALFVVVLPFLVVFLLIRCLVR